MTRSPSITPLVVVAGAFGSLDTALNIAFPDLSAHFGLSVSELQWVVVAYVLAYGGPLLAAGQLGDRFGHRRVLSSGAAVSIVALGLCAAAPSFGWFLAGRSLQGIGTALVMASVPAMVTLAAGESGRGRALGRFQTSAAVGLAVGPVVGGPLVDAGGWPAVFWFRLPIAALLLALSLVVGRTDPAAGVALPLPERPRVDVAGGVLVTVALTAGLLAANGGRTFGWTSPAVLGALLLTTVALGGIGPAARRAEAPIVSPKLLRSQDFVAANLLAIIANGATFVTWLLMPGLLVDRFGWGVLVAGCCLAIAPATMALLAPLAGRRFDKGRDANLIVLGLLVQAAALQQLARLGDRSGQGAATATIVVLGMVGVGAGLGLFVVPNMSTIMNSLPPGSQGVGAGLAMLSRTAGIVVSVALSSALFDAFEPERGYGATFSIVFQTMASLALLAGLCEGVRRRRQVFAPNRRSEARSSVRP